MSTEPGHAAPCPGAIVVEELEHGVDQTPTATTDHDPAGDTADAHAGAGAADAVPELFTAPEKLTSIAQVIASRPTRDPKVNALVGVLKSGLGRRLILDRVLDLLPPLDEPDEWDQWLALLVGCALELTSDGVELDVDACRAAGRATITSLFEGAG